MTLEEGKFQKCLNASLPGSRISQTWITWGTSEKHKFLPLPRCWVQCGSEQAQEFGFLRDAYALQV